MIETSQRVCGGLLDKPKAARPQRHVPKFGVYRLMFQLLRSLPPWPGEGHATAQIQVSPRACQVAKLSPAFARQGTGGPHSASKSNCPLHAGLQLQVRQSQGTSANPAPVCTNPPTSPSNATALELIPTISFTNVAMAFWLVSCHTLSPTTPAGELQETQSPLFWGNNSGASRRTDWKGRGRG